MCKHLGVDDEGLFKEVMRRAREKLKGFPDNLTKFPILLLEVLVQPPKDWLDKICFSVIYRCCSAFCPSLFVSVLLAEAST